MVYIAIPAVVGIVKFSVIAVLSSACVATTEMRDLLDVHGIPTISLGLGFELLHEAARVHHTVRHGDYVGVFELGMRRDRRKRTRREDNREDDIRDIEELHYVCLVRVCVK